MHWVVILSALKIKPRKDAIMRKEQALGLHVGDEVIMKASKEVCRVANDPRMDGTEVRVDVLSQTEGYLILDHKSIK